MTLAIMLGAAVAHADSGRVKDSVSGHWYQRFDTSRSWPQAKNFCESLGGSLATITSAGEDTFVYSNLGANSPQFAWLGASDTQTEGEWRLVNNRRASYTQWAGGEPNNCNDIEHYLMYFNPADGRAGSWNDIGSGYSSSGQPGGCGCGGCVDEWYGMSTICEWSSLPSEVMGATHTWAGNNNPSDSLGGNDGSLMGGAGFAAGISGQAFALDGVDDYVSVADNSALNLGNQDFTIALWVNFNSLAGEQVMVEKYIETLCWPSYGWTLTKLADNQILFAGGPVEGGLPNSLAITPPGLGVNAWNHLAVSRTGSLVTIYWNGQPLGADNLAFEANSTATLKLGHRGNPEDTPGSNDGSGFYLNGRLDNVTIFNHALTRQEVTTLVNSSN